VTYTQEQAERLHNLLGEAMTEYVDHQSWRCEHRPHFYLIGGEPRDGHCPCGLDEFMERVRVALVDATPLPSTQGRGDA
jgi:hypothetical protein